MITCLPKNNLSDPNDRKSKILQIISIDYCPVTEVQNDTYTEYVDPMHGPPLRPYFETNLQLLDA